MPAELTDEAGLLVSGKSLGIVVDSLRLHHDQFAEAHHAALKLCSNGGDCPSCRGRSSYLAGVAAVLEVARTAEAAEDNKVANQNQAANITTQLINEARKHE